MAPAPGIPELLAPAGGPAAFYAALAAGADAIYCALGHDFNARRGADNFTAEGFEEACRVAHLAGARVYVTQNVVIKDEEMPRALEAARRAWCRGADALIVQDLGLAFELRRRWPQIELHASTQMNVHDARGVAFVRDAFGLARVTLSRELTAAEIARIAREGVELEGFGHGALCFCYSGLCLMSSMKGARSANRGLCAQPCRLPQELVDERGRSLSAPGRERGICPKDYCTIDDLPALAASGLGSLKVEGRMKAADYVWAVVSAYRGALDALASGRGEAEGEAAARRRLLKRAFNRDFTNGYLHGVSSDAMMSYERSNNRGELVGTVVASRDLGTYKRATRRDDGRTRVRTHRQAEVVVRLDAPVGRGDLVELRPPADPTRFVTALAPADCAAGDELTMSCALLVPPGSRARVIRSQATLDAAERAARPISAPRRAVRVRVVARRGEPFAVELACVDGSARARAHGFVVEAARTRAVTADDLVEHVGRLGGSPFVAEGFEVELDEGCGMGFSAVHEVRAEACRLLEEALLAPYAKRRGQTPRAPHAAGVAAGLREERTARGIPEPGGAASAAEGSAADVGGMRSAPLGLEVCALVATSEAARAAREAGAQRLYAADGALGQGTWPDDVIPWLDEVCREADHAHLDPLVRAGRPVGVGNLSELALACERGALPEIRPCMPVHNESCLVALEGLGATGVWLSPELSLTEIARLAPRASVPVGLVVSGRVRTMTSEHCVLQVADRCVGDCARCELRRRDLALVDIDGGRQPVRTDLHGRSRIYCAHPLDLTPELGQLAAAGVTRVMADCTLLDAAATARAVARVTSAVAAVQAGRAPAPREVGAITGHLFAPVD